MINGIKCFNSKRKCRNLEMLLLQILTRNVYLSINASVRGTLAFITWQILRINVYKSAELVDLCIGNDQWAHKLYCKNAFYGTNQNYQWMHMFVRKVLFYRIVHPQKVRTTGKSSKNHIENRKSTQLRNNDQSMGSLKTNRHKLSNDRVVKIYINAQH